MSNTAPRAVFKSDLNRLLGSFLRASSIADALVRVPDGPGYWMVSGRQLVRIEILCSIVHLF